MFEDRFLFPLAPEFWGSWSDSELETDSFVHKTYVVRSDIRSEPL
jgi:hypothetical protein